MNPASDNLEDLKYPIGKVVIPEKITSKHIMEWITILDEFPQRLTRLVSNLNNEQLDTPYRPDGWSIRQVVHHLSDSHHNSYTRFKWTLTEDRPVIKAYFEDRWAELHDSKSAPILLSLHALTALHAKWTYFLRGLSPQELKREFIHPDGKKAISLAENIGIYAWHCKHHYAHISNLLKRKGWNN